MADNDSKYVKELKKQITKLKRELAQARKKNNRLINEITEFEDELEEFQEPIREIPQEDDKIRCRDCHQKTAKAIDAGVYRVICCEDCGARYRQK